MASVPIRRARYSVGCSFSAVPLYLYSEKLAHEEARQEACARGIKEYMVEVFESPRLWDRTYVPKPQEKASEERYVLDKGEWKLSEKWTREKMFA